MLTSLRLQHFRSYVDESFEFDPGVNIVVGPNASGKTNLLEAVLVVATGSSYRAKDAELVQFHEPWARLDGQTTEGESRTVKLEHTPRLFKKSFVIDDTPLQRLAVGRMLPVVVFEPEHMLLLGGQPELRRSFLDNLLAQIKPGFNQLRTQYKRTVAQRNALLKRGYDVAERQLFPWNIRLSELGGQLASARQELIEACNERIGDLYSTIAGRPSEVGLVYMTPFTHGTYSSQYLHKLENSLELDLQRGFTGSGPHREDMRVLLNGHPAGETASRGETRTLILALKMLELEMLEKARDLRPMLLLDDVFSELDGARRRALTDFLQDHQTFITTTDADIVVKHFMQRCSIIPTKRHE